MHAKHDVNGKSNGVTHHAHGIAPLDVDALYAGTRLVVLGGTGFLGKIFWILFVYV